MYLSVNRNLITDIMQAYIPTKQDLKQIIRETVKETLSETLPQAIREGTRQKWLTTDDVMEMLQCSRRHVQYLRDSGQLPYSQNNRTIRYNVEDVEKYLNRGKVGARDA